jgi:hypothetical protein
MASASDLLELEALCPWERPDFREGLQSLRASTAESARRFAADMRVLAELAAQVPRCAFDERGATPWTSFRREVALARSLSDQGAAAEIRCARMLCAVLPRMRSLLESGDVTVQRARAFVDEVSCFDDELATLIDAELAQRAAGLPVWRIVQEVRRAALRLDAEAAALRTASKNAGRSVSLQPEADDQATVLVTGPAVPVTRWYASLDARARALRQAGDPRTLDNLRFDLATSTFPCATHAPADGNAADGPVGAAAPADGAAGAVEAGLRPSFVESASTDCRLSRPVQASITVPVETALGLSNEPAWLDGYGWLSAPTTRLLLVDAELRQVCAQSSTGQLVDVAARDVRPPPTPAGVRASLLDMVLDPITLTGTGARREDQHDPSPPLRELVELRDGFCDGPTGTRASAKRCDADHEIPYPHGPTAAWNLVARSRRTHQLKHYGWTPLRTPTSIFWFSPAGQVVEVARHQQRPPGIDPDPGRKAGLPDPDELTQLEQAQLQPPIEDDHRPWLPASERDTTSWGWLDDHPPF